MFTLFYSTLWHDNFLWDYYSSYLILSYLIQYVPTRESWEISCFVRCHQLRHFTNLFECTVVVPHVIWVQGMTETNVIEHYADCNIIKGISHLHRQESSMFGKHSRQYRWKNCCKDGDKCISQVLDTNLKKDTGVSRNATVYLLPVHFQGCE